MQHTENVEHLSYDARIIFGKNSEIAIKLNSTGTVFCNMCLEFHLIAILPPIVVAPPPGDAVWSVDFRENH